MVLLKKFMEEVFIIIFHFETFSPNSLKIFTSEKLKLTKDQLIDII